MQHPRPATYRPDIEGLRAVAIGGVVVFHYGLGPIDGGFTGVDIFFVLSGFLIAGILKADADKGLFRPATFYERRVRRIVPALLIVLAVSALASTRLLPNDLKIIGLSFMSAATFTSNFYFSSLANDYFASGALGTQPTLHTWSLAIEAQFYLVFPWLWWLASRSPRRRNALLGAVALASFAISVWSVYRWPQSAFYMLPGRFWEFMTGGLLALVEWPAFGRRTASLIAALGLGLIAIGYGALSEAVPFPGFAALLPCLGTGLVLAAGRTANPVSGLLGLKPLRGLGRISYGLYLWHWPLLIIASYGRAATVPLSDRLLALFLAIVLATLSWLLIERPIIARKRLIAWRPLFGTCAAGTLVVVLLGLALNLTGQNKFNFIQLPPNVLMLANGQFDRIEGKCGPPKALDGKTCRFGDPDKAPTIAVWGNSFAHMWTPALDIEARKAGVAGATLALARCPPLLDETFAKVRGCTRFNRDVLAYIAGHPELKTVILGGNWASWLEEMPGLDRTVKELLALNRRVVLVGSPPQQPYAPPRTLALAALRGEAPPPPVTEPAARAYQAPSQAFLDRLAAANGLTLIDPFTVLCHDGRCPAESNGRALYSDESHITAYASGLHPDLFSGLFEKPTN